MEIKSSRRSFNLKTIILFYCIFLLVWIIAWIVFDNVKDRLSFFPKSDSDFYYWVCMKLIIWFMPAIFLSRYLKSVSGIEVFGLKYFKSSFFWGILVGFILFSINVGVRYIRGATLLNLALTTSWINAILISPVVEEVLFRGVILNALNTKLRSAYSNLVTAFLFMITHLPGWYFKNKLRENILNPVGGAFSIFLLGLLFGWVAQKTKSVSGSIVVHCLNNLSSI